MTFGDAYYALMAFVATIPVITSFSIGAGVVLVCVVWVLLGEPDTAGTAEQETERQDLTTRWAWYEQHPTLTHANLAPEGRFKRVDSDGEEFRALLAGGGFLGEG